MKTREIEKIRGFEREKERKEYRIGELGGIHGRLLGSNFDFSQQSGLERERKLSRSFSSLLGENHIKMGKGMKWEREKVQFEF